MSAYLVEDQKKITTLTISRMKSEGKKIAMLTAYDFTTASIVDAAGVDMILIGDSAANVMAGYNTTLPITLDEMIVYARSVVRGVRRALVVCDMPFGSYQASVADAVDNAVRIMKETGCDAVKLEGGAERIPAVRAIVEAGIPVVGHLGLTPQSIHAFGSFGVRAKEEAEAAKLLSDAAALEAAGCFALVVEKIPATLTASLLQHLHIPVIGIGAGAADGQVLVVNDMLGLTADFHPKFVRRYADLRTTMTDAINQYVADVKAAAFPSADESY